MIDPKMIPDEAVKAALLADERLGMRTVIAAALTAWPGSLIHEPDGLDPVLNPLRLVLPIHQKEQQ